MEHSDATTQPPFPPVRRAIQTVLILATIAFSWFAMMAVHELCHALAGILTGGTLVGINLHPLRFSSTQVAPNPYPVIEIIAGPLGGALLPLLVYTLAKACRRSWDYLAGFFAGVCLVANGAYLAFGWIDAVGDTGQLLRLGVPAWLMIVLGIPMMVAGLGCWHRLGRSFGFGKDRTAINPRHVIAMPIFLASLLAIEYLTGTWTTP